MTPSESRLIAAATKLYGICVDYPSQMALVESHCWGPGCGKGIFAILPGELPVGKLVACRCDDCPIQESLMDDLGLKINDEPMILRKLAAKRPAKEAKG